MLWSIVLAVECTSVYTRCGLLLPFSDWRQTASERH
jgi:hypothetical protein